MTIIERTVSTRTPPEAVFPYLVDFRNAPEWDPATRSCERLSGDGGPGTVSRTVSEFAGTNKANAVVWNAGEDFDAIAGQLRERGVVFEVYPELGMDIADGIHRSGGFKGVWFKDPDGNVLHVTNM